MSSFHKVFDRSNRRIRGLWERNGSFYVQAMVVDAETGLKKLNKIRLNGVTERNDAIKAMYDLLKNIKDGEITSVKSGPDFKTFREHYKKVICKTPKSVICDDNCLKHWQKFLGADIKIGKITPRQIIAYRGQLLQRGLAPNTANHHVKALRALLKLAKTEKYISKLPMEGITPLKVKSVEKKLFSSEDILKIATEALRSHPITGKQFADFLLLCMYSGGRKSEVANLKWENVDWEIRGLDPTWKPASLRPKVDDKIVEVITANASPMTAEAIVQAVGGAFSPWKIKNVLKKKSVGPKALFTPVDGNKYTVRA